MDGLAEVLERSTWNTEMCECPICGHTKESTCEWINKNMGGCKCCVGVPKRDNVGL